MSRNFEEEYREYLNAQAPDIWDRIEAGIDAVSSPDVQGGDNVIPIGTGQKKRAKKKKQIRYQHYRAIVSAAACLFALLLIIPVYLLVRPAEKSESATETAEQIVLTDATITNTTEEAVVEEAAVEESAPEETVALEEAVSEEAADVFSVQDMQSGVEGNTDIPLQDDAQEPEKEGDATQLASAGTEQESEEDGSIAQEADLETSVLAEEEWNVTILSEEGRQEAGMLYTAAVVGSTSSATLSIIVPDDSQITLEIGGQYTVTLQQFVEEGYHVVVDAVKQ